MTPTDYSDRLAALLEQQIPAMEAVRDCLKEERRALAERDSAALEQAAGRKAELIGAAGQLEKKRLQIAPDRESMDRLSVTPGIRDRWHLLLQLTRECRQLNDANGMLIRAQQRRVETTLDIVRGTPSATAVYGPDGERHPAGRQKTLASA